VNPLPITPTSDYASGEAAAAMAARPPPEVSTDESMTGKSSPSPLQRHRSTAPEESSYESRSAVTPPVQPFHGASRHKMEKFHDPSIVVPWHPLNDVRIEVSLSKEQLDLLPNPELLAYFQGPPRHTWEMAVPDNPHLHPMIKRFIIESGFAEASLELMDIRVAIRKFDSRVQKNPNPLHISILMPTNLNIMLHSVKWNRDIFFGAPFKVEAHEHFHNLLPNRVPQSYRTNSELSVYNHPTPDIFEYPSDFYRPNAPEFSTNFYVLSGWDSKLIPKDEQDSSDGSSSQQPVDPSTQPANPAVKPEHDSDKDMTTPEPKKEQCSPAAAPHEPTVAPQQASASSSVAPSPPAPADLAAGQIDPKELSDGIEVPHVEQPILEQPTELAESSLPSQPQNSLPSSNVAQLTSNFEDDDVWESMCKNQAAAQQKAIDEQAASEAAQQAQLHEQTATDIDYDYGNQQFVYD